MINAKEELYDCSNYDIGESGAGCATEDTDFRKYE